MIEEHDPARRGHSGMEVSYMGCSGVVLGCDVYGFVCRCHGAVSTAEPALLLVSAILTGPSGVRLASCCPLAGSGRRSFQVWLVPTSKVAARHRVSVGAGCLLCFAHVGFPGMRLRDRAVLASSDVWLLGIPLGTMWCIR
jgi:hypothetical protein